VKLYYTTNNKQKRSRYYYDSTGTRYCWVTEDGVRLVKAYVPYTRIRKARSVKSEPISLITKIKAFFLIALIISGIYISHISPDTQYVQATEPIVLSPIPSPTVTSRPTVTTSPSPIQQEKEPRTSSKGAVSQGEGHILNTILPITRECGLPDALVASQWAVESGRAQTSKINNFFALGPHIVYPSLERNVSDYCLTVVNIASKNGLTIDSTTTAYEILLALQSGNTRYEAHNEDPMTYVRTVSNTPEWRQYE
jgi:hypothetical protein